ncbi:quinol monooxygenase YgiN [Maribacter spongiicola]|uniref:Quinol monooxygenase YgiN n=1 Tax=Maribacter spongiicola TaxID=1206753 RepID=A0A4R7K346_9FLAO|nr:putative quinol monooxygenase [Maribacter spongiicola]TDT45292.1 quinol monooxygenase YgiN [Maribacter spongiicola]
MKKSYLTLVVNVVVKEEFREEIKSELLKLVGPTRGEEGNIAYDLHQDNENPNLFLFHEKWVNQAYLDKHSQSSHIAVYRVASKDKLENLSAYKMTELTA